MPKIGQTSTNTGDLPRGNSWSLAQILCSWAADVNAIEYIAIAAIASPSNKCSVATHSNKCKMHNNCNVLLCNSELKEKNVRGISFYPLLSK